MSLDACATLVERGDPDRFLAVLAAPIPARADLLPLFAFNLEVARAPWVTKEPMIAEMRLQWWRDILAEPAPRAHEVASPLHDLIHRRGLPVTVLDKMVEARRWDIYKDPFADATAFDSYLDQTAGSLMWLSAVALGAPTSAEDAVRDYGWASGLANFLRAVPELEERGRVPLVDGRAEAVRGLARQGLDRLAKARHRASAVPASVRPALLPGWQAEGFLKQAVADPMAVAEGRLRLSEFARRGGLLWQSLSGRY